MTHHEIRVKVMNGQAIPSIPPPGFMQVGDTVGYVSDDGDVRVLFELPFSDAQDVVQPGDRRTLARPGIFFGKCFVTQAGGTETVWDPDNPKSGGEHDVRP